MQVPNLNRRAFLRATALTAAHASLPIWFTARAQDVSAPKPVLSPNERPALALIGCGGMGRADARSASRFGDIVAICDVDTQRLDAAAQDFPKAKRYSDARKCLNQLGLNAIINGTPDHWHTPINLAAIRRKLDIYSEKPLTLTLEEGRRLVSAVRSGRTVLQTGSQQRSDARFRLAVELVRNGRIGKLKHIITSLPSGRHGGPFEHTPPPEHLDWDQWQGPVDAVPYVRERCHGSFRYWWDYSAGTLTDWGAHHNDIALWALGLPSREAGPVAIEGHALRDPVPGGFSFPSTYWVQYRYANGVTHLCRTVSTEDGGGRELQKDQPPGQIPNGVVFEGADGWIFVRRGSITASDPALLTDPLENPEWQAPVSNDHMANFFECLTTRKDPVCPADVGHRSVSLCHLGAIAIRLGRPLRWNPARERFDEDDEANNLRRRPARAGYDTTWDA